MSDTAIDWVLKFLTAEISSFHFYFRFHVFWDFICLFFFLIYLFLHIIWLWHYLTQTLTKPWHCLTLTLSDTAIDWVLKFLTAEISSFHFYFRFHVFWDFICLFFFLIYLFLHIILLWLYLTLTLTKSWHCLTLTLSDTDVDWVLNFLSSENFVFSFFFFFFFFLRFHFFFVISFFLRFLFFLFWDLIFWDFFCDIIYFFIYYLTLTLSDSNINEILTLSDTDIVWHGHWLSSEIFEFWKFFVFIFVLDFMFFEISFVCFFFNLFISSYYLILTLSDSDIN